jgi:hypothetical protein
VKDRNIGSALKGEWVLTKVAANIEGKREIRFIIPVVCRYIPTVPDVLPVRGDDDHYHGQFEVALGGLHTQGREVTQRKIELRIIDISIKMSTL